VQIRDMKGATDVGSGICRRNLGSTLPRFPTRGAMADQLVVSLHEARLVLISGRDNFLAFAHSYLAPLLDQTGAGPNIKVMLEWDAVLSDESRSDLEQLGRRIWVGPYRLRHTEIWQVPGLQMDVSRQDETLVVRAAYAWPTRRAKWFARVMSWTRERLFVSLTYYLVYFPLAWWLERERRWTLLHASAIAMPEGGVVFSGLPGCGKSTVALAALNVPEWQIVSDNLLFTDGHQVFAFPEPIHVDGRTRALVGDLADRVRPAGRRFSHQRQDYEVTSGARRLSTTPQALGFLHVGPETVIQPIGQVTAVRRLMANDCLAKEWMAYQESAAAMHQVWPAVGDHERRQSNLMTLARSIPCYDVSIARNDDVQQAMKVITQAMLDG
jgi:hypothetical protein